MNIENIALVRVMDYIPLEGEIEPTSESKYLTKKTSTEFGFAMYQLLKQKGMIQEIVDWTNEDEVKKIDGNNNKIQSNYLPYSAEYNSMSLWSINGMVPDDINCKFANKDCGVIDGLKEQLEESQIISLVSTDTAIKGKTKLSNQATILVRKEKYDLLSEEEKNKLMSNGIKVEIFEGSLEEAISVNLENNERYTSEKPSLRREDRGFKESETSEELIETLDKIAEEKNIPQVLHYNVITKQNNDLDRLEMVKDEFDNMNLIDEFYQKNFFTYLFSKLDINDRVKADAMYNMNSGIYMEKLCEEIDKIGLEEYKKVLDTYNSSLEQLQHNGKLPIPQQIVDSIRAKKPINLVDIIEKECGSEISMKAVISKAIKDGVTLEKVNEIDSIEHNTKEKEGVTKDGN